MKLCWHEKNGRKFGSPSVRRAWIEICGETGLKIMCASSPSVRRAWIEISVVRPAYRGAKVSPSVRRAWIEILYSQPYLLD